MTHPTPSALPAPPLATCALPTSALLLTCTLPTPTVPPQPELLSVYEECAQADAATAEYSPDPVSIGRRRLRDACLSYLACLDTADTTELCMRQLKSARCITDALAAFSCASKVSGPQRLEASDIFAAKVQDDPLYARTQWGEEWAAHAMRSGGFWPSGSAEAAAHPLRSQPSCLCVTRALDKWYRTRASAEVPTALAEVQELMKLPSFSLTNPNRVRAVVGAFTMLNHKTFHKEDGSGYAFTAQCVLDLDKVRRQRCHAASRGIAAAVLLPLQCLPWGTLPSALSGCPVS